MAPFGCPAGSDVVTLNWNEVKIEPNATVQTVTFSNGVQVTLTQSRSGDLNWVSKLEQLSDAQGKLLDFQSDGCAKDVISASGGGNPAFPAGYVTLSMTFDVPILGLNFAVCDVDSGTDSADAVRVRLFGSATNQNPVSTTYSGTGDVRGECILLGAL